MITKIQDDEDIFDIAISMQYFKNYRSSNDNIHTYSQHFLYRSVYKKLMSFSKDELETVFWDSTTKKFHSNPKSEDFSIKFSENIFEVNQSLKNSLFFSAFIEKKSFVKYYNSPVKLLLKDKKTPHSLDFLETLYNIQNCNDNQINKNLFNFDYEIFSYVKNLDTEEKNEIYIKYINYLIEKNPKDYVKFILKNITSFNEQHILITQSKSKEYKININDYALYEEIFPKENSGNFFISSIGFELINKAFDYGFRANKYQFKGLNFINTLYSYDLGYNTVGDNFAIPFMKKVLSCSSLEEVEAFTVHMSTDLLKLKKYGTNFESLYKELLNKKLYEKLPELNKTKQPKI